ncbi:MAG: hypothetical protein LBC20_18025 [Planctomycetaceae bacterium]|nr:hypothetical protein [Planctomycetaceae bacterium]
MFGAITTETEIDWFTVSVITIPNSFTLIIPTMCDGITNHQQTDIAFFHLGDIICMTFNPPFIFPVGWRCRNTLCIKRRCQNKNSPKT